MKIEIDTSQIGALGRRIASVPQKIPLALSRGVNKAGDKARTQMRRALVKQTGLKYGVFVRALRVKPSTPATMTYEIRSRGGNVSLKFFKPRERKGGVVAKPWNTSTTYAGAFVKSGRKPNRFASSRLKGHVFRNIDGGRWGGRIRIVKSGVFIPEEMVTGSSAQQFHAAVASELPAAIDKALSSALR